MGNDIGYDSIVGGGSHATTLHWIDNTGPMVPGQMVLLDMGVEGLNLYTADVTRTLPIDGTYTSLQRELYDLVYAAQEAGISAVRPGEPFVAAHHAAMDVLAHGLESL
jgi:Xaa-Pro aminopeptidase